MFCHSRRRLARTELHISSTCSTTELQPLPQSQFSVKLRSFCNLQDLSLLFAKASLVTGPCSRAKPTMAKAQRISKGDRTTLSTFSDLCLNPQHYDSLWSFFLSPYLPGGRRITSSKTKHLEHSRSPWHTVRTLLRKPRAQQCSVLASTCPLCTKP